MTAPADDTKHDDGMGRVIRLRPRGIPPRRAAVGDLSRYERTDDHDDYRHRMITNGLAFLVCVVLVVAGVWIADTMASLRKDQDCVLSGRRGCTPIDVPVRSRW